MTLADSACPQSKERVRFLERLCVDARSAVPAKAQATSATAVGNCLEHLEPAARQLELTVLDMHDPPKRRSRVDLAVFTVADCAAFRV